jgi:predicted dehydrogenase
MTWKIGILGLVHDHVWEHVSELSQRDDVVLSVADHNAPLLQKTRDEYGVERLHDDYAALMEKEHPDAVLIFTDNAAGTDAIELAASHGKPIMIEKPLANTLRNAERARVAARSAGIPVMVNWPTAWNPAIRHALHLAADGLVGDIFRFSFRGGHGGPKEFGCSPWFYNWLYDRDINGAGAYIDYCGYGASMARVLLGMPSRAQATIGRLQKDYVDVDDNAILVLRYQHAMAVIEATWTASGPVPDGGPAIWGRDGTLVVRRQPTRREGEIVRVGVVQHITRDNPDGDTLEPPSLPEGERTATSHFLSCLGDDRPFDDVVSLEVARDTQEILAASLWAARTGNEASLPLDVV